VETIREIARVGNSSQEEFLNACGALDPVGLLVKQGNGQEAAFCFLHQPFALVGRNSLNDVVLNDRKVSRRHAYLQVLGGKVFCVDLNSKTGTHWLARRRIRGWFDPMDSLQLGSCTLRLLAHSSSEQAIRAIDPMAAGSLKKPLVTLEFLCAGLKRPFWSMNQVLALFGSAAYCKIRLRDRGIAPIHGSLVCTPQGTWVVDLRGPAGIYLNGQRIHLARLQEGDRLQIGKFEMRVHCDATEFALQPTRALAQRAFAKSASIVNGRISKSDCGRPMEETSPEPLPLISHTQENREEDKIKAMVEKVFLPMVQQFCVVQNQMFDQFQQTVGLMFQMFSALQKDQIELVRVELNRIQELSREIQLLHTELSKPGPGKPSASATIPAEFVPGFTSTDAPRTASAAKFAGQPPGVAGNSSPPPVELATKAAQGQSAAAKPAVNGNPSSGADVHAWLCKRMVELQDDRRSRLQKITDYLCGN
jgi:pSer/pThr/pTyr-binding forkhead associated (FHA) protein